MTRTCCPWRIILVSCCTAVLLYPPTSLAAEKTLNVLVSTFPLYQITRNITAGVDKVKVELMIPAQLGCPHDYALVPQDMKKLAGADILIINGLGMEEFLGAPLKKAHPGLKIIDSSQGIGPLLLYTEMETDAHKHDGQEAKHHEKQTLKADHEHQHHAEVPNPHLFASPRMVALLTNSIAAQLAHIDPTGAALYTDHARTYSQAMNRLADEFAALGKRLRNNRIVTQHGVLDYLARDMGLAIVAVVQAHAGQEPSASEMLQIIATVKREKAGAIFTEPQYPEAVGKTIAKGAGIPAAILDPVANGPEQAPLDYFEKVMRTNLVTLEQTLGSN